MIPPPFNVVNYLTHRLKQLGVDHLFAVPGDYTSDFLTIVDHELEPIQRIGNCNELNAGMAAYGYALGKAANGGKAISCVSVTTGVGAISVLNAITAAYVERVPIVLVIGTISTRKLLTAINTREQYHHITGVPHENRHLFGNVTADFEKITDAATAGAQIDSALMACINSSMPVAIEIPQDMYYMPCDLPVGSFPVHGCNSYDTIQAMAATHNNKFAKQVVRDVAASVTAAYDLLKGATSPVFWIGAEVARYRLQQKMIDILELTNANWASSLLGKGVLTETTPNFIGVYEGSFERSETKTIIDNSDCFIGIGTWNTDLHELAPTPTTTPHIWATKNIVTIRTDGVVENKVASLENFLNGLYDKLVADPLARATPKKFETIKQHYRSTDNITYDSFGIMLNEYLTNDHIVVGDIGLFTFGTLSYLDIKVQGGFMCQSLWAHIGWSVPGCLGAGLGSGLRPVAVVGDGSFRVTCQEIATIVEIGLPAVIFILANSVYGIEQVLEDASPYKQGSSSPFDEANTLSCWDYASLLKGFSGSKDNAQSITVNMAGDLISAWHTINTDRQSTFLISVNIPKRDYPTAWSPFVTRRT